MRSRCSEAAAPALLRGIEEFNAERFFEQHETLEDAWIEEAGAIRYLYQGILQIGVGFLHLSRGNFRGATQLLERGMRLLAPFVPDCMGVDVERLLTETDRARLALLAGGPEGIGHFNHGLIPKIRLVETRNEQLRSDG